MTGRISYGHYVCQRCGKGYLVNDGTWRRCTSDFCHDCMEHLDDQFAWVPIDKNGKDVPQ